MGKGEVNVGVHGKRMEKRECQGIRSSAGCTQRMRQPEMRNKQVLLSLFQQLAGIIGHVVLSRG
jgi:hypothetical protein